MFSLYILYLLTFVSPDHCYGYLQSKTSSVTSSRSIGLFVRFYWPTFCCLFLATSVSLPPSPSIEPPSFATAVVLVWHRSVRSNLINSCKFNYWLTAPRLCALYLFLASPRASISSCLLIFFHPFFLFHRAAPRTNPSRHSSFLWASSAFSFSTKLCGERDCS